MAEEDQWLDEAAGPVVRPYALTRGRTRPTGEVLDLIALVTAVRGIEVDTVGLDPEHLALLQMCRLPASVADLAADLDLPLGVVQVLLADLRDRSLIHVHHPARPSQMPDPRILKEVADGLRRL
ncbi:MAG: DUF742 domain-containing protein [Actinobacteria bacterium]|nr:DUF742 domain-containing protein [Actinomycetota bacterium]